MKKALRRVRSVLIVEDHPVVVEGLRYALGDEPSLELAGHAKSESEAVRMARELEPDVVIVDLSLGRGSGLNTIKSLASENEKMRILVFTMHDEAVYAERAMRCGAHGYVQKSSNVDGLLAAIHEVIAGRTVVSEELTERLVQRAIGDVGGGGAGERASGVESLSDREVEVFEQIGRGRPLANIARSLGISVKTVETHRENIKRKLGLDSANELTRFAAIWTDHPEGTGLDPEAGAGAGR
jgi:DNA-binding NarL/FixJ family response regulator